MEAKYLLEDGNNVMVFQKFSAVYNYNEKSIKNAMSMDIIKGVSWKGSYQRWCKKEARRDQHLICLLIQWGILIIFLRSQ